MIKVFRLIIGFLIVVASANAQDTWTQKEDFGGSNIYLATGFSIGDKGCIGTGNPQVGGDYTDDFWEYDQSNNSWTQRAYFEGA